MSAQWDRLVESDGFQRLPPDERARVRNNYFEKVLAPRIPPEKLGTALKRWDSYRPEDKRNPKAVELMGDAGYAEAPTRSRLPVPLRADLLDDVQPGEIYNDAQGRQAVIKNGQAFPMSAGFDQATAAPQTIARAQPEAPAPDPSDDALRGAFGKASPDKDRPISDNLATDAAMSLGARAAMLPADLAVGTADLAARVVRGGFRAYDALGIPGAGWVADQITPIKDQQALQDTYMRGRRAIQDAVSRNLSLETQEQQQAVSAAMDAAADGSGSLLDMVNQVWAGASAMTNNPRALAVTVAETVPDMFVAGGFARAAAAPLFKKTYDLHVRAGFNPRAAALIAAKRTSAMATGAAAGAEATIAANMSADQAAAAIDDVSDEELAAVSPRFASLLPQVGGDEARRMMKADAMDTAAGLSAGITAVAGRLTGASSQIGKIATRGIVPETVSRSIPGAVARGVGAQGAEEFIQEGGDAFAQNRAAIDSGADPERDSMRGVMAQAGAGAVAGAALGVPIGAAGNIGTGEPLKPEPAKPRMSLREYMDIRSGKKKAAPPVAPKAEPAKSVVVEDVTLTQQVDEDGTPYWTAPGIERAFTTPEEFAEWRADQKAKAEEAAVTAEIKTLLEKETPSGEISPAEVAAPSDGQPGDQTLGGARALPADEGRADGDGGADAGMPAPGMRPPVPVAEPKSKRAPALKTPPTGGVSRSKAPKPETAEDIEANERRYLMKMLRGTGIDIGERTDITREQPRTAARMAPGLFRKGGRTIDDVATDLYNAGYISETDFNDVDGGIQAARDLIYNAITKSEPVLSIEARDRWIALRNDEAMTAQDAADEVGVDPFDFGAMPDFELSSESKPDVIDYALVEQANEADEAAVEMAARQFENDDAGFMRAVQEIIDGRAEAARQADPIVGSGEASEGGARGSGQAVATGEPAASQTEVTQGPDTGAFSLAQQTEASRQKDEARVAQAEAQKQKQRQQAEMRAQSERDAADFTLTGSDRPRDVGVPAGQAEMLVDEAPRAKAAPAADAQPATEQAPTTPAKTSPGYLEDGPSVPDAKFKPGETVNARPGRTIDEAKVVRVFDREVAGMKTRVAVIERPDGKRLQVNEGELSAGRFGSPAAGETSGKQAQPAGARRPQPGESDYTLVDALNDLMEMRAQADRQGSVADDRLMSSIRQQEKLVKDMEAAAAKPSDYEKVIAKAESQIQVRSRQTGQTQWVTLRNDWTEGNRKDGSKVSVRSGGMVARVMEIDPADVVDWGSTSQGTGGKTSKKADLATRKVSENTVFTEDAAAKARELLRKKLGQINTGIDPEIMQAGITLAGYHVEKGARTFAAYAKAMVEDLGDSVKPYLKSWYMGVKYDPRATQFDGMTSAADVESANVDALVQEAANATRELDSAGTGALEGAPAEGVQADGPGRDAAEGTDRGSRADSPGDGADGERRVQPSGGLGGDAGEVPVPARGTRRKRGSTQQRGVSDDARSDAGNERDQDAGRADRLTAPNVAPTPATAFTPTDFVIGDEISLGAGGQKTKYKANVEAIRTLKALEAEQRPATKEEQATLALYVGWGGISQAFDADNKDWSKEHAELKGLLTEAEYDAARRSTRYAHYTSREIIGGIYTALGRMGFSGGKVLEPGTGVGNFIGLMPSGLKSASRVTGIEREALAAGIARNLYPQQNIQVADFTQFKGNDDYFDAAIGNPPFASDSLVDQSGRKHLSGLSVHNYFFAKSVDMLREGGVLAMVVSNSFMDAKRDTARKYISDRTKLLGAIRLPNNAFSKNANTEVTTDIIFLQKRPESEWGTRATMAEAKTWLDPVSVPDARGGAPLLLNPYFVDNPQMMLGEWGRSGSMYGPDQPALVAREGQDTAALLQDAVTRLPADIYVSAAEIGTDKLQGQTVEALSNPTVQEGGFYEQDGKLYQRLPDVADEARGRVLKPGTMWTAKTSLGQKGYEKILALSEMRGTLRRLLAAELQDDVKSMGTERAALNKQYDAFVKAHGFINAPSTARVFDDDPDYPLLSALEFDYTPAIREGEGKARKIVSPETARKAPIFSKRVVEARQKITRAESPADALQISIAERGRIDENYIGELLDKNPSQVLEELTEGDKPLLFRDPASDSYVLRDAYLSGNVRVKLEQARQAGMMNNARELEKVIPEDVGAHEISARVGSPWVPERIYEDFAKELLGDGTTATVRYVPVNSSYAVAINAGSDINNTNKWGTPNYAGSELLASLLNNRDIKVTYRDSEGKTHTNKEATEQANIKAQEIRERFQDWLFADSERAELLVRAYNDANNNYVTRKYDGSWLRFPGKVPDSIIKFRRHQRNAIARIVQDRTTLLDHTVGAGKTFTVIAGAMELKRTGLAKKPLVVVPNHLVKQWAADFYRLYPGAKVLTATKKDFERINRRRFLARIATGDWDAVVMAHSSFGFVKPAPDFEAKFNAAQVQLVVDTIEQLQRDEGKDTTSKRTVKQLEGLKERLENRIKSLRDRPIDGLLDFAEIGVDQLFVDEAHMFKNLMFSTKMQSVSGLGDPKGSQRAYDMFVKVNQLYDQNGRGQGTVFATGTPVSNSLAEMYHMMRYLMPDQMQALGFQSFDAWANTFASVQQEFLQKASGKDFKAVNKMSNFVNTHELLKLFDQVSDTVTLQDIKAAFREENGGKEFPIPPVKTGRRQPVSLVKSQAQDDYMDLIAKRAAEVEKRRGPPQKGDDNILVVMTDARKAAMDIRLVRPDIIEREAGGRIDSAASNIVERYRQYDDVKGAQLVFSDMGTPIKTAKKELKEYEELRARIDKGADESLQIAANMGDESALSVMEDAEAAQAEMDAMGTDWADSVQAALRGFSVYDDLRTALVERGIPSDEIAFIHDYNTDDQKAGLFRAVNSGRIRVVVGSTAKMGAGTNVQERLVALHHLDVPWRPSDIEQREGRIERQGNKLFDDPSESIPGFEVEILAYVTQDTLDMRMWQIQESKLKMINQLRTRQISRDFENAFEDMEMSAGEMQAAATGNMDLLREIKIRNDIKKLEQKKRSFDAQRNDLISRRRRAEQSIKALPAQIQEAQAFANAVAEYAGDVAKSRRGFSVTINGDTFTDREEATDALQALLDAKVKGEDGKEKKAALSVEFNGTTYTNRLLLSEAFAEARGDATPILWTYEGEQFVTRRSIIKAIQQPIAEAIAEEKEFEVGNMGPIKIAVEGGKSNLGVAYLDVVVSAGGQESNAQIYLKEAGEPEDLARAAAQKVISAADNMTRDAGSQVSYYKAQLDRDTKSLKEMGEPNDTGAWPDQQKLDSARAEHKALLARLKQAADATAKETAADPDITRLQGNVAPASGRPEAPEWERGQVDKLNGILARQAGQEVPLRAVETPKAMRGMSEMLETLLGRKAVFFESNDPRAPAGVYVSGGVLFVNADALQPLRHVLGHEFTHSLEGPAAELHAILKARILEMAKDGAFPAYEARLEKVYQRDGLTKLSRAKVENEFVADVMGSVMSDPKVLFDLKQRMEPNAFKRLMNRLRFWIEKMMSRLRREDMRQSQFAQRTMRDLQSVKTLVADVLQATAEGQLRPAMGDAAMEGQPMFARNGQWGQFPDAAILSPPNTANAHRDYAAAKAGDTAAAYRLARDLLTPDRVEVLRQALRGASPVIVPVLAVEAAGNNRIPLAAAEVLGDALGLDVSTDIMQAKKVSRGGSDGWHRIAVQPTFDGEVRRGADYLILDDTLAQGGTLAALKTHIEQGGGRVVLASALTGKQYSSKLAPSEQTLNQLREQYGELESWWRSELGYGFVGLTESEARYILKSGQDADGIRDRIVAARNEAGERRNPTDDRPRQGESDVTQNPPDGGFSDSGADVAFSRRGQTDPDDADGLMTETLGKETVGQKLYRNVLNRFSEVERAVNYLKGKGVAIPDERDPGSLEKTFYGRTQTRLDDLKDTTKALFKVMNKAGVSFKQASDYLYALHAEERNAAIAERNSMFPDGGSGMTNRQAKKILADTAALPKEQRDALAEVSRVVQAINRQKLNLMREAGLISAQQYQDLTTGYQHYVPLKSVVDPEEQGQGTGNGFDQRSTVIREAYGRASRAEDPLAVALLDAQKTFVRAEKNRVGRAVYNLILETSGEQGLISGPAGDYWRVLTPEEYPKQARKVQVPVIDSKTGRPKKDTKGRIVTTEDVQYVPNMNDLYRRDEIFMARVDGNLVVMEFQNKQLARQLKNMAGEQLTGVLRGMSVATKFFGRLLTQYNPEFAVPNFIRDVQTAYLNAFGADMEDPKGFAFDVMKNLRKGAASSFKGKKDPLYREFLEAGGATGAYGLTGVDDIKAEYEKLVERQRKGISPGVVMEAGKKFIEKVERFNEVFENTTRLAIYKAARDRGLSKQESARLAKDTTVNFNQKGELQWPGALYVFFNAAMQGNIAMLKAAARSKVTQSAMAGLMIFGLLESLAEGDDEEGEPMGDAAGKWALGREFTAFLDDNTFIKVPLAYGYNVPYAMGRMLGRSIKGNASPAEAIGTSLSTFMTSFVPTDTLVPTIAEPFLSVLNNETAFDSTIYRRSFGDDTFDPIAYRDYEEKRLTGLMQMLHQLAGGDRYEPNVIKEATGFDPFSASGAEALVKGYIGPQWRLAKGLVGALAAGGKAVTGNFTADDVPDLNEVPVTRRFVNERSPFFYDSRFGDITREADAARKTIESMRESRTPIGDRYTPEQVRAVNNTRLFAAYDRKLRKAIDMTPDETRKAELEARRAKLVKDSIRRYNEAFE